MKKVAQNRHLFCVTPFPDSNPGFVEDAYASLPLLRSVVPARPYVWGSLIYNR